MTPGAALPKHRRYFASSTHLAGRAMDSGSDGTTSVDIISEPATLLPAEQPTTIWTRRLILIAFWAVVVLLGLPYWLWTTSIVRSNLPLDLMNLWASGEACTLRFPLYIQLVESSGNTEKAQKLANSIQSGLNTRDSHTGFDYVVSTGADHDTPPANMRQQMQGATPSEQGHSEPALTITVSDDPRSHSTQASLRSWEPVLDIQHNSERAVDAATLAPFIISKIEDVFRDDMTALSYAVSKGPFSHNNGNRSLSAEAMASFDSKSTRAFKYASHYHLTFSLFTASASPSAWDIQKALESSIAPFLRRMSTISNFSVNTQVQLYASFSPSISGPVYDESSRQWVLQRSDLSGFINAAEWPLSPSIGPGPTINFVLYVPSPEQSPLVIAETGGDSWLIPQWGGVRILNPKGRSSNKLMEEELGPVMLTFAEQLASLLGVPSTPPSMALRISSLTRQRAASLILSASSTLGALSRLTLKLTSIAIPESVARSVNETLLRLDLACQDLTAGRYESALANARVAEDEAEHAFFEPSMVGQVYFPDEHKLAVYMPLLGPMAVPLVMAALKEIRRLRERKIKTA